MNELTVDSSLCQVAIIINILFYYYIYFECKLINYWYTICNHANDIFSKYIKLLSIKKKW